MTDKEKAIVMSYTGICMLTDDKFQIFHKYVEDIMGRPIMTHEMGLLSDTIKEKARPDFMALCADESGSEKMGKWIKKMVRGSEELYCSNCGNGIDVIYEYNFCPNCGARMSESEVEE